MKFRTLAICFCIACLSGYANDKIIKLPLTEKNGYGPFESALGGVSTYSEDDENDPWKKTRPQISGRPENWTDLKFGVINTDMYQFTYQNYYLGNITKERYEELQKSWNWEPDSLALSKKTIKCRIAFAAGRDSNGETIMVIDANNNLDLSDDKTFKPLVIDPHNDTNRDSLANSNSINVTYEQVVDRKIVEVNAPLFIVYMSQLDMFLCNFPQYATAKLNEKEIVICSNDFVDLSYTHPKIALLSDNQEEKINHQKIISKNEYIEIGNKIYKNLGVNRIEKVLVLEETAFTKAQLYSTQVGYKSFDFTGSDFKTSDPILSDSLKGKYVLLDFWAVWCGPCIKEIPNLKSLYGKVDKSKFEIIGIVGDSPSEALDKMITEQSMSWPQIVSNNSNKLKEKYGVYSYPTTYLIDPEGIIVAKNLRGKELEEKIISLLDE